MSSSGPSPIFVPLLPSPRLVAQMTGLSLKQSELEVRQQHNLKRVLKRIKESRRRTAGRTPLGHHVTRIKGVMSALHLPDSVVVVEGESGNNNDWSDEEDDAGDGMLRKMDVFVDIADSPDEEELKRRVAKLFNDVFASVPPVNSSQIEISRLSGAMTNCVFMVTVTPPPTISAALVPSSPFISNYQNNHKEETLVKMPKKYLLRVYGMGVDEFLSREKELYWLSQLTTLGFGPQLYGIFGNGRLEEFLESTTLGKDDIRDSSTSKHIARRMSELHSLVSYYRPFAHMTENHKNIIPRSKSAVFCHSSGSTKNIPELWRNIEAWMHLVHEKWQRIYNICHTSRLCMEILDNWSRVENAAVKLRTLVEASKSSVVFAHADLQYGNILRLKHTGELVVVDFEYAGYNYRGFDIANHFCEWMADYYHPDHPHLLNEDMYPTQSERECFLRTYIKAKFFLDANMKADPDVVESDMDLSIQLRAVNLSEDRLHAEVHALEREIAPFVPASHFHWGIWGLLQACSSEIDFDYVEYAAQRLSIFLRQVDKMA
ncbi:kinase-like protein [Coemansia reversa NRRL 1564]|uniref:Kinase-like protein n=1 Tax=Coemansia reversa (strain ATCC 12441 / NRRL 1564) TaxID=763665 RepID=A0A2G5B3W8_COERN|nr:kinase-like protein [Coemansia reversa NRRL 1564]|eukprot:PIA13696.1 kinase-like protein [Coemansia reversa NRRL 1564]